ncbi:winged helix-turn-helix domain-containing protein [uncultured Methanobrevibacter sp.]|uniref:helix-turn-helix transcriptional regulator n=1 Tax=uncultured Methanobrevibacter sp. TaxID=253161 RepID=UPI0026109B0F|nr:transcriptional regulator FilR1 domain-containing protein [uncultured Methanobrevibacter sp.]
MTSAQTKKELTKEFKDVKYILTSSMRTKLLLAVYDNPKNLDELRNELKKPSATILHGLKELESINLMRKAQKYYELTSNGYLLTANMIKLIDNWYSLSKSEIFWNNHDLSDIPEEIIRNVYLLKNGEYISSTTSDLSIAFNRYIKLISKAKELTILLPIYSENHFKHIIDLLNKGKLKKLELIVSEEIYNSIKKNRLFEKELLENKKVNTTVTDKNFKIFLTYSEEFISLTLFFKDGHYDDSQILIAKDDDAKKWALSIIKLFER